MTTPALVGIDWGTTRFRAYLIDETGAVIDRVSSDDGIMAVKPGGFPAVLAIRCGKFIGPSNADDAQLRHLRQEAGPVVPIGAQFEQATNGEARAVQERLAIHDERIAVYPLQCHDYAPL